MTLRNMHKSKLFIVLLLAQHGSAQIAIGKDNISSPSVSLEFGQGNKGLILPWITDADLLATAEPGTMVFDLSDYKIKVKCQAHGWKDFSTKEKNEILPGIPNQEVDANGQNQLNELTTKGLSVGNTSDADGVLVLKDTAKAMVLPKVVDPHLSIINPSAGMIVYDPISRLLCVFNGSVWSFWTYLNDTAAP